MNFPEFDKKPLFLLSFSKKICNFLILKFKYKSSLMNIFKHQLNKNSEKD